MLRRNTDPLRSREGCEPLPPVKLVRTLCALSLVATLAATLAAPARAQSLVARSEGIALGRFTLYPSVSLDFTDDSNVFYRSEDLVDAGRIASGVLIVRPRI